MVSWVSPTREKAAQAAAGPAEKLPVGAVTSPTPTASSGTTAEFPAASVSLTVGRHSPWPAYTCPIVLPDVHAWSAVWSPQVTTRVMSVAGDTSSDSAVCVTVTLEPLRSSRKVPVGAVRSELRGQRGGSALAGAV